MNENKIFIAYDIIVIIATCISLTMLIISPNPLTISLFVSHLFIVFFFLAITIQLIKDSKERNKNVKKKYKK